MLLLFDSQNVWHAGVKMTPYNSNIFLNIFRCLQNNNNKKTHTKTNKQTNKKPNKKQCAVMIVIGAGMAT